MTVRPCIEHGCTEYALDGGSRCARHHAEFEKGRWDSGSTSRRGGSHSPAAGVRKLVFRRQKGHCFRCGQYLRDGWELHHLDGDATNNLIVNLVAVHPACHDELEAMKRNQPDSNADAVSGGLVAC